MSEPGSSSHLPTIAILSGGLATRLRPITASIPKSLIPIAGEPFIAHQMRMLAQEGFKEAVLLCGFLGEQIQEYVGDGNRFGIHVRYSFDGDILRGTGGAIRQALPILGDEFMAVYGDSWCPTRYRPIWEFFLTSGKDGLMTVFENNDQWDASNVTFENGSILVYDKIAKVPSMHHIDYGIGAYKARAFEHRSADTAFDLSAVQRRLLESNQLAGFLVKERFYEIGSPSGLQEANDFITSMRSEKESQGELAK